MAVLALVKPLPQEILNSKKGNYKVSKPGVKNGTSQTVSPTSTPSKLGRIEMCTFQSDCCLS